MATENKASLATRWPSGVRLPVVLTFEHQSGEAVDVCVPYKKGLFGRMKYGELFAGKREPTFFVQNKSP